MHYHMINALKTLYKIKVYISYLKLIVKIWIKLIINVLLLPRLEHYKLLLKMMQARREKDILMSFKNIFLFVSVPPYIHHRVCQLVKTIQCMSGID